MLQFVLALMLQSTEATAITKAVSYDGHCMIGSRIASIGPQIAPSVIPIACDGAVFNGGPNQGLWQFGLKKGNVLTGFGGAQGGAHTDVERMYVVPGKPMRVNVGVCQVITGDYRRQIKSVSCFAAIDQPKGRVTAAVTFIPTGDAVWTQP